jgi:peptidoglycan/LPS O-acetylase OafA/YrhL
VSYSPRPLRGVLKQAHLPILDGLRAIAVGTVIFGHANYPVRGIPSDLGVSAFFVLSGFLITRLLLQEHESTGHLSIARFYMRRTLRIFPAYYAFVIISYAVDAWHGHQWDPVLLRSALTYTVNYFNAFHHHPTTSVAHAWSLAVEEQFYLLWPLVFIILMARGRRAVITGVGAIALAVVVWRSWLTLAVHADPSYVYNAFDTRFDNIAIGCLLALTLGYSGAMSSAEWIGRRAWYPLITLALVLFSRLAMPQAYHYSIGFSVDALLVAVLIVQLLQLHGTPLWSWLDTPAVRYLGVISYPMYLYHAWGASFGHRFPVHGRGIEFAAGLLATILLASGSYYFIERPFLRVKRRFASEKEIARAGGGMERATVTAFPASA